MKGNTQKIFIGLLAVGMTLLLATAIMPLAGFSFSWAKYVYACGAILTLAARFFDRYSGTNLALKRLYRIQFVSSLCYCISAATLCIQFGDLVSGKDWLAFLMAGAVLQIYSSWRIQSEENKETKKEQ